MGDLIQNHMEQLPVISDQEITSDEVIYPDSEVDEANVKAAREWLNHIDYDGDKDELARQAAGLPASPGFAVTPPRAASLSNIPAAGNTQPLLTTASAEDSTGWGKNVTEDDQAQSPKLSIHDKSFIQDPVEATAYRGSLQPFDPVLGGFGFFMAPERPVGAKQGRRNKLAEYLLGPAPEDTGTRTKPNEITADWNTKKSGPITDGTTAKAEDDTVILPAYQPKQPKNAREKLRTILTIPKRVAGKVIDFYNTTDQEKYTRRMSTSITAGAIAVLAATELTLAAKGHPNIFSYLYQSPNP